jgi:hypothetical protein
MKFSTILKSGDSYEIIAGATFSCGLIHQRECILSRPWWLGNTVLRPEGWLITSNELLFSPDVLFRNFLGNVAIMKAAVRMGDPPILIPDSDAARFEAQQHAHAVCILDPPRLQESGPSTPDPLVELDAMNNPELSRRILMPTLAILTEGDVLGVNIVQHAWKHTGVFKDPELSKNVLEQFKVTFDGTNIKLDGANVKLMSQECFV